MQETNHITTVIRYKDYDGDYVYVASFRETDGKIFFVNDCYSLDGALDVADSPKDIINQVYDMFQTDNPNKDVEVVKITTKITVEDIMLDDPDYVEIRQKGALAKLTEKDIKVLNLTSIAVYIKTKFHNA